MKASKAQRLQGDESREQVGIAKSLAHMKKYREAAGTSDSPLTLRALQELGRERDFREMRGTKWGQVFRLWVHRRLPSARARRQLRGPGVARGRPKGAAGSAESSLRSPRGAKVWASFAEGRLRSGRRERARVGDA